VIPGDLSDRDSAATATATATATCNRLIWGADIKSGKTPCEIVTEAFVETV
jgi:hypothetical protein